MSDDFRNLSVGTVGDVLGHKKATLVNLQGEVLITRAEAEELAEELRYGGHLNFTVLENKKLVAKVCREKKIATFSHTAHGSLLDPRYTVEGRHIPDRGFANDYKHFTPKLYCLEGSRR